MQTLTRRTPAAWLGAVAFAATVATVAGAAAPGRTPAALGVDDGDDRYVAIRCGRLITGAGEEKEKVTLLLKNGKVELIGEKVELPHPCEVIDATAFTVMPGHIHPHSRISLFDYPRTGMRADLKVQDEFLPTADAFDAALAAGFTTLHLVPPGAAGIPGRGLVVRTADVGGGYVIDDDGPIKINLVRPDQDRRMLNEALSGAKREIEKVEKARADWEAKKKAAEEAKKKEEEAKKQQAGAPPPGSPAPGQPPAPAPPAPAPAPKADDPPKPPEGPKPEAKPEAAAEFQPPPIAPPLQPFVDLIQKKAGVLAYVRLGGGVGGGGGFGGGGAAVGGATNYLHFLEATKEFEIAHVLQFENTPLLGRPAAFSGTPGTELHWIAKQVGEHKELVVCWPNLSYMQQTVDFVNVPQKMLEAGARVAFAPRLENPDELNLFRFNVAEIIEGGMKRADAVTALTKHAAEAIGVADRLGTLEPGKDANLLFVSGDPFDAKSRLERVVIEGKVVWTREKKTRS